MSAAPNLDLTGQRALVTGSGQGVGRGIAMALAAHGATVLINDLVVERADQVVKEVQADGGAAQAAVFDVTSWDAVQAAIDSVGGVDILVNNAGNAGGDGWTGQVPFAETDPASWERYIRINLYGVMNCIRAALPGMIDKRQGRIVTIVSDSGRAGDANLGAYAAAKAGAAGLSRCVASEVGRARDHGELRVAGDHPAPVEESDAELMRTDPMLKRRLSEYVIRRRGEPDDVAAMVSLLVSPAASWITGQTYPVNGGYTFSL